jgi:asparagine synthase (glutamine-hydrolysing)
VASQQQAEPNIRKAEPKAPQHTAVDDFQLEEEFGFLPRFITLKNGAEYSRLVDAVRHVSPVSLDFAALNTFFRTGMFLNGTTPFEEIRRRCPPPVIVPTNDLSREAAIEAYIELFRLAISRRISARSAIGLSGGCDSRHILLELYAQNRLPDYAVTVDLPERPSEARIAAELARRTGIKHIVVAEKPSQSVQDEIWKNHCTDFMSLEHGWFASVSRHRDALDWWDGIAGDVMSAGLFLETWNLKLFQQNGLDELAERLVSKHRVPAFRDQETFSREQVLAEIRTELEKHASAPNPVASFYFWNRTRVNISSSAFGLLRPSLQRTLAPYLDKDLWTFLASLPAHLFIEHRFHEDVIRKAYPAFASIPFSKEKIKTSASIQRLKAVVLFAYLMKSSESIRGKMLTAGRLARSILYPPHAPDLDWLLPLTVYCIELKRLQKEAAVE